MSEPILRVAQTGLGGSGYRIPTRENGPKDRYIVVGVTTVLKAIDKPAIVQWAVDQTAAYAVHNVDAILDRTHESGYRFLRFAHVNKPKPGDPLRGYHTKVLNDAAELGTNTHDWIEAYVNGEIPPEYSHPEVEQMADEFLFWLSLHDFKPILTEATVFNPEDGYAGTLDLLAWIDGECWLLDIKTSRSTWDEHRSQVAALWKSPVWMRQVDKGTEGAAEYTKDGVTTYWVEAPWPEKPTRFGFLHLRPDDIANDGSPIPAFCELIEIPKEELPLHYDVFCGALKIKKSQRELQLLRKSANVADEVE